MEKIRVRSDNAGAHSLVWALLMILSLFSIVNDVLWCFAEGLN